jgi:predicted RNase H-like HicB family nuclease
VRLANVKESRWNRYRVDGKEPTAMKIVIIIAMVEPGVWASYCPSLPGCRAVGQSREEAAEKIERAVQRCLASHNVGLPLERLVLSPEQDTGIPCASI